MTIIISRRGSWMRFASCRRARRKTPARRRVGTSTLAAAGRLAIRPKPRSERRASQDSLVVAGLAVVSASASGRVGKLIGGEAQVWLWQPQPHRVEELRPAAWRAAT